MFFAKDFFTTKTGAEVLIEALARKESQEKVLMRSLQEIHSKRESASKCLRFNQIADVVTNNFLNHLFCRRVGR
jgi:hypothetical protein